MRRNDRKGPGMTNCDEGASDPSSAEESAPASACLAGKGCSPLRANRWQFKRDNPIRTETQNGDFTAGFLTEPARPHSTWNRSRKGRVLQFAKSNYFQI